MSRTYLFWDTVTIGADLTTDATGHILQISASCDAHRLARSSAAVSKLSAVEMQAYSPSGASPSLVSAGGVPPISEGICTAAASTADYLGKDANGWGWCRGDGKVYNNGAVVTTLGTCALKGYAEHIVDPEAGTWTIKVAGTPIGTVAITAGQSWFYAGTISGDPDQLALAANPGDTPLRYPQGDLGYWSPSTAVEQVLLATEPYITAADDPIPNLNYEGDLDRRQSPAAISNGVRVWMFGDSAPAELGSGLLLQRQINDPLRQYGRLMADGMKGAPDVLLRGGGRDAIGTFETVFTGIYDHAEPDAQYGAQVLHAVSRGKTSLLDTTLRRPLFSPAADASVAGKPRPMRLGPAYEYTPELEDADAALYALTDQGGITAFGTVREFGLPLVYGTDFQISDDGCSVTYLTDGGGRRIFETTTYGGSFDAGAPDYLAATGEFDTATPDGGGRPTGWTASPTSYLSLATWQVVGGSGVKQRNEPFEDFSLSESTYKILAGRAYTFELVITQVPGFGSTFGPDGTPAPPATLQLAYATGGAAHSAFFAQMALDHTGTYTGSFTSPLTTDQDLVINLQSNNVDNTAGLNYLMLKSIKLNELPAVATVSDLEGPGLDWMLQALMITRGPAKLTEYKATDAQAVDTATGYRYSMAVSSNEDPTIRSLVDQLVIPTCGAVYDDEDGFFRYGQLIDPDTVADGDLAFDLNVTDSAGPMLIIPDLAENLTARVCGGRIIDPLGASDYGDTPLSGVDSVPQATRRLLAQPYLWTVAAGIQLATRYAKAYQREPIVMPVSRAADGLAAIRYGNGLYTVPRLFAQWQFFEPFGRLLRIFSVGRITLPHVPEFAAGKKVVFLGYAPRIPSGGGSIAHPTCAGIFWGKQVSE